MRSDYMMTANDVAQALGISKGHAYKIVRELNDELEAKVLLTAPFVQNQSVSVVRKLSVCMPTPFPQSAYCMPNHE